MSQDNRSLPFAKIFIFSILILLSTGFINSAQHEDINLFDLDENLYGNSFLFLNSFSEGLGVDDYEETAGAKTRNFFDGLFGVDYGILERNDEELPMQLDPKERNEAPPGEADLGLLAQLPPLHHSVTLSSSQGYGASSPKHESKSGKESPSAKPLTVAEPAVQKKKNKNPTLSAIKAKSCPIKIWEIVKLLPAGQFNLSPRYINVLGHGVSGMVVKATDIRRGAFNPVAIKVFNYKKNIVGDREIKCLSQLNHPHIVKYIDSFNVNVVGKTKNDKKHGKAASVMVIELIQGKSLHNTGAMSIKDFAIMAARLLSALHHMHSKGIVHNDLHRGNVMVEKNGNVKIIDFGHSHDDVLPTMGLRRGSGMRVQPQSDPITTSKEEFGLTVDYYSLAYILGRHYNRFEESTGNPFRTNNEDLNQLLNILTEKDQNLRWQYCFQQFSDLFKLPFFQNNLPPGFLNSPIYRNLPFTGAKRLLEHLTNLP